ncbi:bifunctional Delta(1)-pyrroline-2-carboxylate/Delta(1)-piperideine-2-carboxylate reductase [Burkholderia sp. 22PA0106]|uniref:bifunctional Delta(1)-pyrroline-2-carboxylate/Delta(1)-piperideine-2- carboxylate reductase n=1 Tax=Burkholderia sp. 22PA0106 TaxID=3237371 RepID=UPI0039C1FD3C
MSSIPVFDAAATAALLDFKTLVDALAEASVQHEAGEIHSPVRVGVPLGAEGVLLSMPASARDVAIHKLVSVAPGNAQRGLPTIFGTVTVCDGETGRPEFILDGPTVTARRTAALSMLGVRVLHASQPKAMLIVGTGQQARAHALAMGNLYPAARLWVRGRSAETEAAFCARLAQQGVIVAGLAGAAAGGGAIPDEVDTVVMATTSKVPVYTEAARENRLVIGVGAFTPDAAEIGAQTIRASRVFVDDRKAAQAEAGDLIQAGVDGSQVCTIGAAVRDGVEQGGAVVFKTVGSGAWDLAAGRVARGARRVT